jgi:hypothetical protein
MEEALKIAAHVLGITAMAGVWLVPAHLWTLINRGGPVTGRQNSRAGIWILIVLSVALSVAAFLGIIALQRVFGCLYESRCTGSRGGTLITLDVFGISVLLAEILWQGARLHGIRWRHR